MSEASPLKNLLDAIGQAVKSRKTRRAELYQNLVASRFATLESVNTGFLTAIQKIDANLKALQTKSIVGANDQRHALESLLAELNELNAWRSQGMSARRHLYEEAKLISESDDVYARDIILILSSNEQVFYRNFMESVKLYFESNQAYEHEFGHILERTNRLVREWIRTEVRPRELSVLLKSIEMAEKELLGRWSAVCSTFSALQISLNFDVEVRGSISRQNDEEARD